MATLVNPTMAGVFPFSIVRVTVCNPTGNTLVNDTGMNEKAREISFVYSAGPPSTFQIMRKSHRSLAIAVSTTVAPDAFSAHAVMGSGMMSDGGISKPQRAM